MNCCLGDKVTQKSYISIADKADYCSFVDGWRGVAILLVVAIHTSQHFGNDGHGEFYFTFTEKLLNSGSRGVQLFYILSAFTLFNSSYRRFKNDSHPKRNFYLRRGFRILPLWWLVIFLFCYLNNKSFLAGGLSATFVFGFLRFNSDLEVVPGGWSLFVEETFYLMLPIIFGEITTLRKASNYTIALILLAVVWSASHWLRLPIPDTNDFIFLFPMNHWYFFGIGIMMYYIISKEKYQNNIIGSNRWKWDVLAICTMPIMMTNYLAAIATMFALCIYVSSCEGTLLNKIMNNKILMRFGVYCYSIYLLHIVILLFIVPYINSFIKMINLHNSPVEVQFFIAFPIIAIISLFVGYCCFNLIEKPSVKLGKTVINKLSDKKSIVPECA